MNITNEAAYLYVHSKELVSLNKRLKRLSRKAEKHVKKHGKTKSEEKKARHKLGHRKATEKIKNLIREHNRVLEKLRHHQVAFAHALREEHKVKS